MPVPPGVFLAERLRACGNHKWEAFEGLKPEAGTALVQSTSPAPPTAAWSVEGGTAAAAWGGFRQQIFRAPAQPGHARTLLGKLLGVSPHWPWSSVGGMPCQAL